MSFHCVLTKNSNSPALFSSQQTPAPVVLLVSPSGRDSDVGFSITPKKIGVLDQRPCLDPCFHQSIRCCRVPDIYKSPNQIAGHDCRDRRRNLKLDRRFAACRAVHISLAAPDQSDLAGQGPGRRPTSRKQRPATSIASWVGLVEDDAVEKAPAGRSRRTIVSSGERLQVVGDLLRAAVPSRDRRAAALRRTLPQRIRMIKAAFSPLPGLQPFQKASRKMLPLPVDPRPFPVRPPSWPRPPRA